MMRLSRNQWIFGVLFLGYTVAFHNLLNRALTDQVYENIWKLAVGYGVLTFLTALVLGRFDSVRRSRGVIGFHYHLITFVVSVGVWIGGNYLGLGAEEEMSKTYIGVMVAWGFGLLVHYGSSRATIKGIPKNQLFD